MTPELRNAYWALVRECLIRFHGFSDRQAELRVSAYVRHLEQAPPDLPMDVVFNNEAFELASRLAGRELDPAPYWDEYMAMMDRHYALVPVPAPARDRPPGYLPAA